MEKYVFSGSLTDEMKDLLENMPDFEPLDVLVSQLDRSTIKKMIDWKKEGFVRWLFIDSGAFSVHTGKAPSWVSTDNYVDYLNEVDEDIDVCAQLDTIPGKFGQPKSPEDYEKSAKDSWDNFLYMRSKMKSPHKLMPVFHFGEDIKYLERMLEWRDESGSKLDVCGLSPANDATKDERILYLRDMYDVIKKSSNPDVKTHIYGFTSLSAMSLFPCYSCDSITHRLISGYAKVYSRKWGIISVSKRDRTSKAKSNWSFVDGADEFNLNELKKECESMNLTLDQLQDSVSARVAFSIRNIQILSKTKYAYKPTNYAKPRKLF